MPLPAEVDQVVLQGFVIDEDGKGVTGEVVSEPVALTGQKASPMVLSAVSHRHIQTLTRRVTPDATTGYFALWVMASNDPDVEAYGGRRVTLPGQDPRTIQVPWNAPKVTITTAMAAKVPGLTVGQEVRAIWYHEAAGFTPPPAGPAWYTADQIDSKLAGGVGGGAPVGDATPDAKGVARLLGGTAEQPTVPWSKVTDVPANPTGIGDLLDQTGHLPRVTIDTVGGVAVDSLTVYRDASITINGSRPFSGTTQIRGRGNSTWGAPKQPYRLKLTTAAALLGMPAERDWVLLANYYDPLSIRNALAFEIGARCPGLAWTPRMRFVELTLNGTYLGLYQLGEQVEISAQRINVTKASGTTGLALTGAYSMEIDQRLELNNDPGFRTTRNTPILLDDPDGSTPEQKTYIQQWMNSFEDALYGSSWLDPTVGYARFIDRPSFIDWYLVNELSRNLDSGFNSSVKLVKAADTATAPGRLYLGPLWDFDNSLNNSFGSTVPATGFYTRDPNAGGHPGAVWIRRMFDDPTFFAALVARWSTLRTALTTGDSIYAAADRLTDRLTLAAARDKRRWSRTVDIPADVETVKTWIKTRLNWLSTQLVLDTTPPSVPTGLAGTPGNGQNGLTWTAATDNIAVAKYRVYRDGTLVGEPTTTSFIDTGRTNGTAYSYQVSALDAAGNESAKSTAVAVTPATDTTPPTTPSGLTVTPGNTQNILTWTASTDNVGVAKYRVRRGGTVVAEPTTTSYTDTGLTNGAAYPYTVSALDAAGNESPQSTSVSATPVSGGATIETFTGADGAAWPSPWVTSAGGSTVKLLSNAGRLSPPAGAYAEATAYRPAPNDGELLMRWQWQSASAERYFDVIVRGQQGSANPKWRLRFGAESIALSAVAAGGPTKTGFPLPVGSWRWLRVKFQGSTVQARTWAEGATEPSAWDVSFTDATAPTSGNVVLMPTNGGDGAAAVVLVDDLSIATL